MQRRLLQLKQRRYLSQYSDNATDWKIGVRVSIQTGILSLRHRVPTGIKAHTLVPTLTQLQSLMAEVILVPICILSPCGQIMTMTRLVSINKLHALSERSISPLPKPTLHLIPCHSEGKRPLYVTHVQKRLCH
jgi:hypothetical protein